jgi:hypothetical protein
VTAKCRRGNGPAHLHARLMMLPEIWHYWWPPFSPSFHSPHKFTLFHSLTDSLTHSLTHVLSHTHALTPSLRLTHSHRSHPHCLHLPPPTPWLLGQSA